MSWRNGRTHQQVTNSARPLDRGTAFRIEQRPLGRGAAVVLVRTAAVGWKHGRWKVCMTAILMKGRVQLYSSRSVDARIVVNITAD